MDKETRRKFITSSVTASLGLAVSIFNFREAVNERSKIRDKAKEVRNRFEKEELVADLNQIQSDILKFHDVEVKPISNDITAELYLNTETGNIKKDLSEIIKQEEYASQIDQILYGAINSIGTEEPLNSYSVTILDDPGSIQYEATTDFIQQLDKYNKLNEVYSSNKDSVQNYLV